MSNKLTFTNNDIGKLFLLETGIIRPLITNNSIKIDTVIRLKSFEYEKDANPTSGERSLEILKGEVVCYVNNVWFDEVGGEAVITGSDLYGQEISESNVKLLNLLYN